MLMQNNISVFVTHHKPNVDRKAFIEDQFNKQNIKFEFVDGFHPDEITKPNSDTISSKEYSLCLKHEHSLKLSIERKNDFCLIFEDDILLCENFNEYFDRFLTEFKTINGDLLMIGTAFNEAPSYIDSNVHVYHEPRFLTRCTHAILYTYNCARIVLNDLHNGYYCGYDHKLNNIISTNNLKSCWLEPGLQQCSMGDTPYFKFSTTIR